MRSSRSTFPRPDFARRQWVSLNGLWNFSFAETQDHQAYQTGNGYNRQILVPFCYQCKKSGIGITDYHETVWYCRTFVISQEQKAGSVLLKFGAVDQSCQLFINGDYVGRHEGGYTQFCFEISSFVHAGENTIALMVSDNRDCAHPRGKQYWKDTPERCWYTETTGIWKSVWLEFTGKHYIENFRCLPDIDRREIQLDLQLSQNVTGTLHIDILWQDRLCRRVSCSIHDRRSLCEVVTLPEEDMVDEIHFWSPEHPNLYSLRLTLESEGRICDQVDSYFGMRQISARGTQIYLNRQPLYQRLILDQGYWLESLTTPPDEDAIIRDLQAIKDMGFNGVRMHQKNEDPLFYYHADRLGLLVWLELPSAYQFNPAEVHSILWQWEEMIRENWNHPSIIAYVPFNESWGVRDIATNPMQRALVSTAYHLTKALDPTRLISTNDGWEFSEDTDLYGVHSYFSGAEAFCQQFSDWPARYRLGMTNRPLQIAGTQLESKPVLITEFGGIAYTQAMSNGAWGYHDAAKSDEEYARRMREHVEAVLQNPAFCGYCYTQLTDVMQEVNGLLRPDRSPKLPMEVLRSIFGHAPLPYQR